eukprot:scaffold134304_cov27-Tisochrysis_lutea.AAC.2
MNFAPAGKAHRRKRTHLREAQLCVLAILVSASSKLASDSSTRARTSWKVSKARGVTTPGLTIPAL